MNRRSFIAGSLALVAPVCEVAAKPSEAKYVLCGDSMAYVTGPSFREVAKIRNVDAAVWAKGGSSARQWLRKKWFERVVKEHPKARVLLISLGVNCTRVERPKLAEDISTIVNLLNDLMYARDDEVRYEAPSAVWLLPPPLAMDTRYIHDAVAKSEVFAIDPGPLPLESDGVHPTRRGARQWAEYMSRVLWE